MSCCRKLDEKKYFAECTYYRKPNVGRCQKVGRFAMRALISFTAGCAAGGLIARREGESGSQFAGRTFATGVMTMVTQAMAEYVTYTWLPLCHNSDQITEDEVIPLVSPQTEGASEPTIQEAGAKTSDGAGSWWDHGRRVPIAIMQRIPMGLVSTWGINILLDHEANDPTNIIGFGLVGCAAGGILEKVAEYSKAKWFKPGGGCDNFINDLFFITDCDYLFESEGDTRKKWLYLGYQTLAYCTRAC